MIILKIVFWFSYFRELSNYLISFYKRKLGALCESCFFHVSRYMFAASVVANPWCCKRAWLRSRSHGRLHRVELGSRFSLIFPLNLFLHLSCTFLSTHLADSQVDNPPQVAPFLISDAHAFSSSSSFLLGISLPPPPLPSSSFLSPTDKYARVV